MHANDESVLVFGIILGKYEFVTILNGIVIIFKLIDQLIRCQKSYVFCFLAETTMSDVGKTFKVNRIESVEIIVLIVSHLTYTIIADHDESSQFSVIKTIENFPFNCHLLTIMLIFTISQFIIWVDLINIVVMVKDEERAFRGYEEAMMFLKV